MLACRRAAAGVPSGSGEAKKANHRGPKRRGRSPRGDRAAQDELEGAGPHRPGASGRLGHCRHPPAHHRLRGTDRGWGAHPGRPRLSDLGLAPHPQVCRHRGHPQGSDRQGGPTRGTGAAPRQAGTGGQGRPQRHRTGAAGRSGGPGGRWSKTTSGPISRCST